VSPTFRRSSWLADGTLRTEETVMDGLEQAPAASLGVLTGANTGKMLVRLDDRPASCPTARGHRPRLGDDHRISQAEHVTATHSFGIDIGGSGIKGAPVDLVKGEFSAERVRIDTPARSTPQNMIKVVMEVLATFEWDAPFGCTFPGVVRRGVVGSAANFDDSWLGVDLAGELADRTGRPVVVVNDADAAGVAEARYGAASGVDGVVIVTTLGTGIGSAILHDGVLQPNTELGHLFLENGWEAEKWAAASVREEEELDWPTWAARLQDYYSHVEFLFSPDLFVVGGGVSKKSEQFLPLLSLETPVVPAGLRNDGGIIGAAYLASVAPR
jgi:polyphosphate glucokinase